MKVAIVSDYLPKYHRIWSGAEIIAVTLSEMLKDKGCDVFFMTTPFDFSTRDDKEVFPVSTPFKRFGTLSRNFPIDIVAMRHIHKVLKEKQPDIVHINAKYLFLPTIIACLKLKIPTVFTVPDYFIFCPTTFIRKPDGNNCDSYHGKGCYECLSVLTDGKLKKLGKVIPETVMRGLLSLRAAEFNCFLKKISAFVVLSKTSQKRLIDYGIPEEKVKLIYHYKLSTLRETNEDIKSPSAVFVGWLSEENGTDILIKAFAQVVSKIKEVKLYLVGTGKDDFISKVKTEIRAFHIIDNVFFLGKKENQEALSIVSKCDVVVVPHQWPKEFGPIILLEALALGKPVITSKIGATDEFIHEGENGFLIGNYRNPEAFADKMFFLFNSQEKIKAMSKKAEESVRYFLGEFSSIEMIKLYNHLLEGEK